MNETQSEDSGIHTDESFDKYAKPSRRDTMKSRVSQVSRDFQGNPNDLNRSRSKRLLDKQQTFKRRETVRDQKIKEMLGNARRQYKLQDAQGKPLERTTTSGTALKSAGELVREFVGFKPSSEFRIIKNKITEVMNENELRVEQAFLTTKLKSVSAFISRMLEKEYTRKQMKDGKQKAIASRKSLTGQPKDEVHEMLLLNMMVKNSYRKQRQLKKELEEIDAQFRRLMDPDLPDRVKAEIAYLDEMIKGES